MTVTLGFKTIPHCQHVSGKLIRKSWTKHTRIIVSHIVNRLRARFQLFVTSSVYSERERESSPIRPSVVCLSSVTFVHPTQTIEIFGNISTPFGTLAPTDIQVKFYGDHPMGNPSVGELNTRRVAEYSDFGPIERYISETVQVGSKLV